LPSASGACGPKKLVGSGRSLFGSVHRRLLQRRRYGLKRRRGIAYSAQSPAEKAKRGFSRISLIPRIGTRGICGRAFATRSQTLEFIGMRSNSG
jgi:hypothetical protein